METQYYTLVEKQNFYEIIENKYGELAVFIDARPGTPVDPVLEFDGKQTALLRRDERLAVRLDNIDPETKNILAEREFVMIVELSGEVVERVYGVPVENVESIFILGRQSRDCAHGENAVHGHGLDVGLYAGAAARVASCDCKCCFHGGESLVVSG